VLESSGYSTSVEWELPVEKAVFNGPRHVYMTNVLQTTSRKLEGNVNFKSIFVYHINNNNNNNNFLPD
jgi:hypothetical protein